MNPTGDQGSHQGAGLAIDRTRFNGGHRVMRFDSNVFYHGLEVYPVDRMLDEWRQTVKLYDQTGFTGV